MRNNSDNNYFLPPSVDVNIIENTANFFKHIRRANLLFNGEHLTDEGFVIFTRRSSSRNDLVRVQEVDFYINFSEVEEFDPLFARQLFVWPVITYMTPKEFDVFIRAICANLHGKHRDGANSRNYLIILTLAKQLHWEKLTSLVRSFIYDGCRNVPFNELLSLYTEIEVEDLEEFHEGLDFSLRGSVVAAMIRIEGSKYHPAFRTACPAIKAAYSNYFYFNHKLEYFRRVITTCGCPMPYKKVELMSTEDMYRPGYSCKLCSTICCKNCYKTDICAWKVATFLQKFYESWEIRNVAGLIASLPLLFPLQDEDAPHAINTNNRRQLMSLKVQKPFVNSPPQTKQKQTPRHKSRIFQPFYHQHN